jgi:quinol monooxygenase YgiN
VIEQLNKVHTFSLVQEPGVLKHCSIIPRDPSDTKSLYVLEEYASQAALDSHTASPAVKSLQSWFSREPAVFEDPTQILSLEPFCGFTRNNGDPAARDPFITFCTLQYESADAVRAASRRWKDATTLTERNEKRGTLSYQVMSQKDEPSMLRSIEVFESERWREAHVRQEHVQKNEEVDLKEGRKWTTALELKVVGGYLGREKPVRSVL